MENLETSTSPTERLREFRCSWIAYVSMIIPTLIQGVVVLALGVLYAPLGWIGLVCMFAFGIYTVLLIKSAVLYTDADGVWHYVGVLPWNRGYSGVKWRDIDEATFKTGFFSWATNSYEVRVGHRFTKESELIAPFIKDGRHAVLHINQTLQAKLSSL